MTNDQIAKMLGPSCEFPDIGGIKTTLGERSISNAAMILTKRCLTLGHMPRFNWSIDGDKLWIRAVPNPAVFDKQFIELVASHCRLKVWQTDQVKGDPETVAVERPASLLEMMTPLRAKSGLVAYCVLEGKCLLAPVMNRQCESA